MRELGTDGIPRNKKRDIDWSKPDANLKYDRLYRNENLVSLKNYKKKYYDLQKNSPEWEAKQKEVLKERHKKQLLIKKQVFIHYSNGVVQCACCGELEYEFLTIDHINGKKEHGHDQGMTGGRLYSWLMENNFPDGFQVLCMNCNWAKGHFDICPHQKLHNQKVYAKHPP